MVKTKFKKAVSLMLAAVMSLTAFMGIGATTAFAAVGEKADVYLVDYPRSGDTNNNGEWGHGNLNYMNGWKGLSTKYTGLRAMGSYSGNIAYCIEPGTGQRTGDTLTEKDENFFNNISPNGTISGDDIRLLIGRILQYGYRGGISTSWKSQNESDANCIAHAYATQILIWETIVGERDAGFNHVSTGGYHRPLYGERLQRLSAERIYRYRSYLAGFPCGAFETGRTGSKGNRPCYRAVYTRFFEYFRKADQC